MKLLPILAAGLITTSLYAQSPEDLENLNPDTARAYKAYLMTFVWPKDMSSETVPYEPVMDPSMITPFDESIETTLSVPSSPFEHFRNTIGAQTHILTNNEWTLIFPDKGTSFNEFIQSNSETDGYPEFTGEITFKLERYLETYMSYKHYRFDPLPTNVEDAQKEGLTESPIVAPIPLMDTGISVVEPSGPTQTLALSFSNKTASTKLNYIDHPVIGTLIYFEPMDLEKAIDEVSGR